MLLLAHVGSIEYQFTQEDGGKPINRTFLDRAKRARGLVVTQFLAINTTQKPAKVRCGKLIDDSHPGCRCPLSGVSFCPHQGGPAARPTGGPVTARRANSLVVPKMTALTG